MKTAVSVPDPVYRKAERLARRLKKSRSRLYSEALAEYVARHSCDEVTEAMDRVCEKMGPGVDPFVQEAARRILKKTEW
jgi:hypothetical protein